MTIDILTIFPKVIQEIFQSSILRRAQVGGKLNLEATDLRDFTEDKYKSVDDTVFGGGQGMLFTAPVLDRALAAQLEKAQGSRENLKVLYPSPRGIQLGQEVLQSLATWLVSQPNSRLVVISGRYEGIDERIVEKWVDLEFSLGDFVVTGGEIPALALSDGIVRLLPGVLGDDRSAKEESFQNGLLEYPQYTRPREFGSQGVPPVLLGGKHKEMSEFKLRESLLLTAAFRPDLIRAHQGENLPLWAKELLFRLKARMDLRNPLFQLDPGKQKN